MNAPLQALRAQIERDREALQKPLAELEAIALEAGAGAGSYAQAAVAEHHTDGAVENVMEPIARALDGDDAHQPGLGGST